MMENPEHKEYRERVGVTQKLVQFVWLIFGVVEGLLGLRFLLKLLGANPNSPFSAFVYQLTQPLLWPFQGIVATPQSGEFVLEAISIIAMIAYALLAWVVVKLIRIVILPATSVPEPVEERHNTPHQEHTAS
ncbi:MAG: YggT family protein [Anaerolineales bacterium]